MGIRREVQRENEYEHSVQGATQESDRVLNHYQCLPNDRGHLRHDRVERLGQASSDIKSRWHRHVGREIVGQVRCPCRDHPPCLGKFAGEVTHIARSRGNDRRGYRDDPGDKDGVNQQHGNRTGWSPTHHHSTSCAVRWPAHPVDNGRHSTRHDRRQEDLDDHALQLDGEQRCHGQCRYKDDGAVSDPPKRGLANLGM